MEVSKLLYQYAYGDQTFKKTCYGIWNVMAQHSDLVFFLLERKSSSLRQLFEDAKGVEENIRACKMLRDQAHVEDIQAYE